jgi:hypothetical protein
MSDSGPARTTALFPIGTAAAEARRLPRGQCPRCGRDVALRRGGELREHNTGDRIGGVATYCIGSGSEPVKSTDGTADVR